MLSYKYYDTPEGKDVFKKVFVTSKYAALTGLPLATLDVLLYSHPTGVYNTVYRYAYYVAPLVGMATAFTITANGLQNYRGKNDSLNYVCGGIAAGAVAGAWQKSAVAGVPLAIVLGAVAMIKKTAIDNDWVFFPPINTATKTVQSVKHDWTMVKDLEHVKTWTTGSN